MRKAKLILMCGLPGAGKTTLAKKLEVQEKALRLCPDDWVLSILRDQKDIEERERLRNPVEQLLWKEAQILLKLGTNVILENGFWSKEERDGYRDMSKKIGAQVELYYLEAPFNVLWERVEKRNSNPNEFMLTKKEMEDYFKVFEPPTKEEGKSYDYFQQIS